MESTPCLILEAWSKQLGTNEHSSFFCGNWGVYAYVRIVTVYGDHDTLMKADVAVYRKATETE